jgi:alkylation response protein AidB-like acyl-CoA dehydrogenase
MASQNPFMLPERHRLIKKEVGEFAEKEFAKYPLLELEERHEYPRELYEKAGELGYIKAGFAKDVGGLGLGSLGSTVVIEKMCQKSPGHGMAVSLGWIPGILLDVCGSEEQRNRYIKPMIEGKLISAVCLTEPNHGSDIRTVDTRVEDRDACYRINGLKTFTTNAGYADFYTLLASDEEASGDKARKLTILVFDKDMISQNKGRISIRNLGRKMGINYTSSGEISFSDFEIPYEGLVGERGKGLANVTRFFNRSRIGIAAQAQGAAEFGVLRAHKYSKERRQFDKPIINFQAIGHDLDRMISDAKQSQLLLYYTASLYDGGHAAAEMFSPVVKFKAPQTAESILSKAIEMFGGYGYMEEMGIERAYRDAKITGIYEGTKQMQLERVKYLLGRTSTDYLESEIF